MKPEDLERSLREWGSMDVPDTDELTVARIESRWRHAVANQRRPHGAVIAGPAGPARRRSFVLGTAAVLAGAASITAVVAFNMDRNDPGRVVVADAEDIVILLPGGRFVDPHPGETLPEGAFVQAGPYADGRIGNRKVGPDDVFVVAGGRLQKAGVDQLEQATPGSSADVISATTAALSTERAASSTRARVTSASTAAAPESSEPPTTVPESTMAQDDSATTEIVAANTVAALRVRARAEEGNVVVNWRKFSDNSFRRYVVFRVDSWDGRSVPTSGRLTGIGAKGITRYVDHAPVQGMVYIVVVVGEGQRVLAIGAADAPGIADAPVIADPTPIEVDSSNP